MAQIFQWSLFRPQETAKINERFSIEHSPSFGTLLLYCGGQACALTGIKRIS
jgi:hypothetical protein